MDATAYSASVSSFFKRLVAAVDAIDPDLLECDATSDMVTITATRTGAKVIVNTQRAVEQIWVAGKGLGPLLLCRRRSLVDDKGRGLSWGVDLRGVGAAGVDLTPAAGASRPASALDSVG